MYCHPSSSATLSHVIYLLFPYTTLFRSNGNGHEVLARAIALREALYRIFRAAGKGKSPSEGDLAILNSELEASLGRLRIGRSEEHTSELQSLRHLVCRLLLEKKTTLHT